MDHGDGGTLLLNILKTLNYALKMYEMYRMWVISH